MMARKTVDLVDAAAAVLCHMSIDLVEAVALDLVEAGTEAERPGLELAEPGSCATSCRSVKVHRLTLIAFFWFS